MKIQITEKKENKLLGRLEVTGQLNFSGATPTNEVVRDSLAVELKVDKELVVIKHIYSKFSHQEAEFLAFVYDNSEQMGKTEVMTKHLRKKAEEAAKKAKEEAEKKEEEKPVEEAPKEEKPAEEKKGKTTPAKEESPTEKVEEEPVAEEFKSEEKGE